MAYDYLKVKKGDGMSSIVVMNYRSGMPAAVIYPNQRVNFLEKELIDEIKILGLSLNQEEINLEKEEKKKYQRGFRLLPPDEKASKEMHAIFAKTFLENEVPTLLRSGYFLGGPEYLEIDRTQSIIDSYWKSKALEQAENLSKVNLSSK